MLCLSLLISASAETGFLVCPLLLGQTLFAFDFVDQDTSKPNESALPTANAALTGQPDI